MTLLARPPGSQGSVFSGQCTISASSISFVLIAATQRACLSDDADQQEHHSWRR
jgi:hypothetical protein